LKQKYRKRPQLSVSSPSLLEVNSPLSSSEIEVLAKKYSGKLLLRHEIHLDESLFQLLLNKRKFTSKKSIYKPFLDRVVFAAIIKIQLYYVHFHVLVAERNTFIAENV